MVLNVANDLLVELFLSEKILFNMIPIYIEKAMDSHHVIKNPAIQEISETTKWTENYIKKMVKI